MTHPPGIDALAGRLGANAAAQLAARVTAVHADGRRIWPGVAVDAEAFSSHLAMCLPRGRKALAALEQSHATDLYLACAVARGQQDGISVFERVLMTDVRLFVAHIDASQAFVDELKQELRLRLLVPDAAGKARIADYSGRGALRGWLRVAAVRTALNLKRSRRGPGAAQTLYRVADASCDLEVAYLRERYRPALAAALRATLATLPLEERNVLRLHYLDGLSLDKLAVVYRVHRATIARWIDRARARIVDETRRALVTRFAIEDSELDAVIALVRSQLDVSLRRLLGAPTELTGEAATRDGGGGRRRADTPRAS